MFLKGERGRKLLLIVGAVGIGLIFLSDLIPNRPESDGMASGKEVIHTEQYTEKMEERLSNLIESVAGAGNCRVMVTLENGTEYRYAQEEKSDQYVKENEQAAQTEEEANSEKTYVILDTSDGKQALIITEIQPAIRGVVVVCQGAGDARVQQRVIDVVTTALGISSAKVCVSPMS